MKFFNNRKERILPTILICLSFGFIAAISTPFDIFVNNIEEFLFKPTDFLGYSFLFGLGSAAILSTLCYLVPEVIYKGLSGLIAGVTFMLFIQGLVLNGAMNSLAGDNLSGEGYSLFSIIFNTFIWVVVIFIFIGFNYFRKPNKETKNTIITILFVAVLAVQVMTPVTGIISTPGVFGDALDRGNTEYEPKAMTNKNMTELASDRNVFVFIIDRFDEQFAKRAYDYNKDIFKELDGFTWYQDNLSFYAHTFPAVPQMLTLKEFDHTGHRVDYLEQAYEGDTPLTKLAENGYEINLYIEQYYSYTTAGMLPSYVNNVIDAEGIVTDSHRQLTLRMMEVGAYRTVPIVLKDIFKDVTSDACNEVTHFSLSSSYQDYKSDNSFTANELTKGVQLNNKKKKKFTFLHVAGCHSIHLSKEPTNQECYEDLRESFDMVNQYIQAFKDAGVYENSTFIITGDHGCPVGDATPIQKYPFQTALFVKPRGVGHGGLKKSKAQVSHQNMWASIFESEGLEHNYGRSYFDIDEKETMTRRIVFQTYWRFTDVWDYKIVGPGDDLANYEITSYMHLDKFIMD